MRVVAVGDSSWGHYVRGNEGTIVKNNPTDPVVRWDASGKELQTSRQKIQSRSALVLVSFIPKSP